MYGTKQKVMGIQIHIKYCLYQNAVHIQEAAGESAKGTTECGRGMPWGVA